MKKVLVILSILVILLWSLVAALPAHAQGPVTPPTPQPIVVSSVTPSDVAALQAAASSASAQLSSAQAGLAAAQAQYAASAAQAAQARAVADQAAQKLQLQQTAQAVELATQARALADQSIQSRDRAGAILQAEQQRVTEAQRSMVVVLEALARAQAGNAQRDAVIAQNSAQSTATIILLTNQINDLHQQRDQTNTLIVLMGFDVLIMACTALFIFRQFHTLRNPVTIVEEHTRAAGPAPDRGEMEARLPNAAPEVVTDQGVLDRIHGIVTGNGDASHQDTGIIS